jgi:hypothetical protein
MPIALLVFALLVIAGAFAGWRKSPLYSRETTLKLIGAFLLIAAVLAGSIAIVNGVSWHTPLAQGIAAFVVIVVIGCGSSILVVSITDAGIPRLPVSARRVAFNRHRFYRWTWRLLIFLFINAVAALALPSSWKLLPVGLAGFAVLFCGPMLSIAWMMALRNDRGMSAMMANPWAHWQYSPEQWSQWANYELAWEAAQEKSWSWKAAWWFVLLCAGLFSLGGLFDGAPGKENLIIVGGLTGFVILLVLGLFLATRSSGARRLHRLLAAPHEAWFGDDGFFCNGEYLPWVLSGRYLLKATAAIDSPARLTLVFQSFTGSSSVLITQRIPIPEAHICDLPALEQKLKARCPTASVHLEAG